MFGFKTKEEKIKKEREKILKKYIFECRKLGFRDDLIIEKLRTINVPQSFLEDNFQLNFIKQEVYKQNMPKETKEKDYDEDEEVEESEEDETDEAEDEDEDDKPKKKIKKPIVKEEENEEPKITAVDVLRNHEERLKNLESAIFRLKAI